MFNRTIYITSFILFLLTFLSCQESTTEPETVNGVVNIQSDNPIPDVDVFGYVIKGTDSVYAASVKLYKGINLLESTTTDINGWYTVNVCSHKQGTGTYNVRAVKYLHGEEWCDSENFYWDQDSTIYEFEIDLYLIRCGRSR